jgi:hypothetical protein
MTTSEGSFFETILIFVIIRWVFIICTESKKDNGNTWEVEVSTHMFLI